jgi:hypothetical protein
LALWVVSAARSLPIEDNNPSWWGSHQQESRCAVSVAGFLRKLGRKVAQRAAKFGVNRFNDR